MNMRSAPRRVASLIALCIVPLMVYAGKASAVPPLPDEFFHDSVDLIAVFDLGQVTPSAIDATGRGIIESTPEFEKAIRSLRDDHSAFVEAGGRFVVISPAFDREDDEDVFVPFAAVGIDPDRCDEESLRTLIERHVTEVTGNPIIERRDDWLIVWKQARNRLNEVDEENPDLIAPTVDPARALHLRTAIAAIDGRAAGIVMIPPQEFRDEVGDDPNLVAPDSPAVIPVLLAQADVIFGWVDLGHNPAITGVGQWPEAKQAAQLAGFIQMLPMIAAAQMPDPEQFAELEIDIEPEMALAMKVLNALSCVQAGNRVTVSIGHAHLRGILDDYAPILAKQQEQAKQVRAMYNGRQVGQSLHVYMMNNDNQWPNSLDDLVTSGQMTWEELDAMLTHPVTGEKNAFQYKKPSQSLDDMPSPHDVIILYELKNGAINQRGCVVYADGHAEWGLRDR